MVLYKVYTKDENKHFMNIYFKDEILNYISLEELQNKRLKDLFFMDFDGKSIVDFIHNDQGYALEFLEGIKIPNSDSLYYHKEIWIDGVHYSLDSDEAKKILTNIEKGGNKI
jgi:hypothetical protein